MSTHRRHRLPFRAGGGRLMRQMMANATARGFTSFVCRTPQHTSNRAPTLFRRLGFKPLLRADGSLLERDVTQPRVDGRSETDRRWFFVRGDPEALVGAKMAK